MSEKKSDPLPLHIRDENNGLDYTLNGDYYFPVIIDPELEDNLALGKWGLMRFNYLKEHRKPLFVQLLLSGELHKHLTDLDKQAHTRHELIVRQMAQAEGVTEQLKMSDQMAWVCKMNNIAARADEIIREEMVYT